MIHRAPLLLLLLCAPVLAGEAPALAHFMPPAGRVPVREAIRGGVEFLVTHQNADGSFGRHTIGRSYELWCQVPGGHQAFRAASTALCYLGLLDVPQQTAAGRRAQARCLHWLAEHAHVKRAFGEQFYNIWPWAYGLRALSRALRLHAPGADPKRIRREIAALLKGLEGLQSPEGGWSYLDFRFPGRRPTSSNSFTTATVLVACDEARRAGIALPEAMVARAVRYLWKNRTPDGNYYYSWGWRYHPAGRINRPQGSSLRNQACNLALHLFDPERLGRADLLRGLDQLVRHHRFAVAGLRRPQPHSSWYAVSGYFYLYGQQYAALVLETLPQEEAAPYWPKLAAFVLKTRQEDGSFWDYPTYDYHKYYGTGYALIALSRHPEARG